MYNSTEFQATNLAGGTTYTAYVIAWASAFASPQAAAASGSPVGWSSPFALYAGASVIDQNIKAFSLEGLAPFGVVGAVLEPSTIALAGMGVASLFAFRRRK